MKHTPEDHTDAADPNMKDIRRKTPKRYSTGAKLSAHSCRSLLYQPVATHTFEDDIEIEAYVSAKLR